MRQGFESPYPPAVSQVGRRVWRLMEQMTFRYGDRVIVVPEGQETDWASVPFFLRWALDPMTGTAAALLHDYLWRVEVPAGRMTYREADEILYWALIELEIDYFTASVMWASVRLGALTRGKEGRTGWSKDALAVLVTMVSMTVLLAVPTLVILPFLGIIWVLRSVSGRKFRASEPTEEDHPYA